MKKKRKKLNHDEDAITEIKINKSLIRRIYDYLRVPDDEETKQANRENQDWYSTDEAVEEYEVLSINERLELMKDFICSTSLLAAMCSHISAAKIDALARLFVFFLIPSTGFLFSGYKNCVSEDKNSLIKEIRDNSLFLKDPDQMIKEVLLWLQEQKAVSKEGERDRAFYERLIVLTIANGEALYTFDVSNKGFFSETLNSFVKNEVGMAQISDHDHLNLGKIGEEDLSYDFRYPVLRLEGDLENIDKVYANILSLNPGIRFAIFDFKGSFYKYKDAKNLFWPLIEQKEAKAMIRALSDMIENKKCRDAENCIRICVLTDDQGKLFSMNDGLLLKNMDCALEAGFIFVYGTNKEEINPIDAVWYTDSVDVRGVQKHDIKSVSSSTAQYDETYYEVVLKKKKKLKERFRDESVDILLDDIKEYIIDEGKVSYQKIINRFGISMKRLNRILLNLEDEGVVSEIQDDGSRTVLVDDDFILADNDIILID